MVARGWGRLASRTADAQENSEAMPTVGPKYRGHKASSSPRRPNAPQNSPVSLINPQTLIHGEQQPGGSTSTPNVPPNTPATSSEASSYYKSTQNGDCKNGPIPHSIVDSSDDPDPSDSKRYQPGSKKACESRIDSEPLTSDDTPGLGMSPAAPRPSHTKKNRKVAFDEDISGTEKPGLFTRRVSRFCHTVSDETSKEVISPPETSKIPKIVGLRMKLRRSTTKSNTEQTIGSGDHDDGSGPQHEALWMRLEKVGDPAGPERQRRSTSTVTEQTLTRAELGGSDEDSFHSCQSRRPTSTGDSSP